jgi:phosphoribosylamine--glycine ligase
MKILVIGGGGREHALIWKLRQSAQVERIWCAPGNGGISADVECLPADLSDVAALVEIAERLNPDLTVVGPEQPLVLGVVDEFEKRGLPILGPSQRAAELEGSKVFAKEFAERNAIPTASLYGIYDSPVEAYVALSSVDWPVVVKADGLCAGKGVLVTSSPDAATEFIERLMEKREFGQAGCRLLLEEGLAGVELSYIVLTDGERVLPLVPTRDHKRAFDGDEGPNTGGMGAVSTDQLLPPDTERLILQRIVAPTIQGLAREGRPYKGFLYFGLMLTAEGPKILEYNCRLGDPETQAILMRADFDLAAALSATLAGQLGGFRANSRPGASACVVLASGGYPGHVQTGRIIAGLDGIKQGVSLAVFHSGTRCEGANYYTTSGRVLSVSAYGPSVDAAATLCYDSVSRIVFEGCRFRHDIGRLGLHKVLAGRDSGRG